MMGKIWVSLESKGLKKKARACRPRAAHMTGPYYYFLILLRDGQPIIHPFNVFFFKSTFLNFGDL